MNQRFPADEQTPASERAPTWRGAPSDASHRGAVRRGNLGILPMTGPMLDLADGAAAPAAPAGGMMPDPAALAALAERFGWCLVVLFGSVAEVGHGRDLDLAVLPRAVPDLLEQGRWQAALEGLAAPMPVDLVLVQPAMSPVTRFAVFRAGRCLYEAAPGLFEQERDRAFFLYADSEWFRHQQREALYGTGRD